MMSGGASTYKMLVWHVRDPFPPQHQKKTGYFKNLTPLDYSNFIIESETDTRHSTNNLGR